METGFQMGGRRVIALVAALSLSALLLACSAGAPPQPPASDRMPLVLARHLFQAGYELVDYYEFDAVSDGVVEAFAILTLRGPVERSHLGDSWVLLFAQRRGEWSLVDSHSLNGINARAELHDMTGDGLSEVLVFTEEADVQLGDFVTPLRFTDHVTVFTYTSEPYILELGAFSSSLAGVVRPCSTVVEWEGLPAVQTVHDLPPGRTPLWRLARVETFAWDGGAFVRVQARERRRISPTLSWLVRRNAPWVALFLLYGGMGGLAVTVLARRFRLPSSINESGNGAASDRGRAAGCSLQRWLLLGLALLCVAGGVGLGLVRDWLCVPALILVGLAALVGGWRVGTYLARTPVRGGRDQKG